MSETNTTLPVNSKETSKLESIRHFILNNIVVLIFVTLSIAAFFISKQPLFFVLSELLQRISRNSFMVLALLIPVMAGMGLNFSIIVGGMAGQMAIIIVTNYGMKGLFGIGAAFVIAIPFAVIFGIMTGKLLNKTRGQEMIAGMILGFFANGIYQFIFLFLVGAVIPLANSNMLLRSGVGLRNTIDLDDGIKYGLDRAFDGAMNQPLFKMLMWASIASIAVFVLIMIINKVRGKSFKTNHITAVVTSTVVLGLSYAIMYVDTLPSDLRMLKNLKFPILTGAIIILLAAFNIVIKKTKLGQDFRTVGQDQHIAQVSGIKVNKVRVIAITLSTLFAAWGQIIFLQNIGVLNTFGSHMQIGLFSVAALLVGGATVKKATVGQAILGVILFHTLFIVTPYAGKEMFGDPQIGEFFRSFVAYGVISVSLILYAWKKTMMNKA